MQHAVLLVSFVFFGLGIALVVTWLVPFSFLLQRLQRKNPGYFKKIGQPFTLFSSADQGAKKGKRLKAWRRFAWRLQKEMPKGFPKDRFSRTLARAYRFAVRFWIGYIAACLLLILPYDILSQISDWQFGGKKAQSASQEDDVTHAGPSNYTAPSGAPKPTPTTVVAPRTILQTDNSEVVFSGTADIPTVTNPAGMTPRLTRADLESVFDSIAPAGQKQSTKQAVCGQLIAQESPEADLGPNPSQICTDPNLQTYSNY